MQGLCCPAGIKVPLLLLRGVWGVSPPRPAPALKNATMSASRGEGNRGGTAEVAMAVDGRGLEMTGSADAVAAYDRAIDHLIRFQPEVVDAAAAAAAADPGSVMPQVFGAYLALMSTEENAVAGAREALAPASAHHAAALPREHAHLAAARRWVAGDMAGAGQLLAEISVRWPRDLLALAVGHQVDFFTGDAVNLRDRIGRALGAWHHDDPQAGFVHGMYAFGLEECNLYGLSADVGLRAVAMNPDDVWGIHAVVHTHEMQGEIAEGIRFLRQREPDWQAGNFMNVHNSWHYALYLLQGNDVPAALAVYDRFLRHAGWRTSRSNCSTRPRCCGGCTWRGSRPVPAGPRWRRPGPGCSRRASTPSTTCTRSWPTSAPATSAGPRRSWPRWNAWWPTAITPRPAGR